LKPLFWIFVLFWTLSCGGVSPGTQSPNSVPWVSADDWKQGGSYILSKYGKIFTVDRGEGEVILFLHGFPTSSYDFHPVVEILKSKHRLLLLDFLGYGYSDKPRDLQYSFKIQTDIVEDFIKQKKITSLYVVAHDYGVTAAQEMMSRCLERKKNQTETYQLKGVVLLNGGLFPETHRPRFMQKVLVSSIGKYVAQYITKGRFQSSFLEVFGEKTRPTESELNEIWKVMSYQDGAKISHKLLHYIEERNTNRTRFVAPLLSGDIPFVLVNGSADPVSGDHVVQRYVDLTGRDNFVKLPEVGHYPQMESDARVAEEIKKFIASLK
jgi:pimeloyl-ACP methyl ester carboxylesterase